MTVKPLKANSLRDTLAKTVKMLIRDGIEVRFRGVQPYVTSKGDKAVMLVLPELNDDASPELLGAIQGFLDHEVGHILYTPFSQHQKYGAGDNRKRSMLNLIEDVRLEKLLPRDLPGTKENLEKMYENAIPMLWAPSVEKYVASPDKSERFSAVLIVAIRALAGQKQFQTYMDNADYWVHFQPLMDVMPTLSRRLREMETSADACSLATDILEAIESIGVAQQQPQPPALGDPQDQDEQDEPSGSGSQKPEKNDDQSDGDGDADGKENDGGDSSDGENGDDDGDDAGDEEEGGEGSGDGEGKDDGSDDDDSEGECSGDQSDGDEEGDGEGDGEGDTEAEPGSEKSKSKGKDTDSGGDETDGDSDGEDDGEDSDSDKSGDGGKSNFTITDALKMLEARQRRALFLYRKRKQTIAQIAESMCESEQTVANLLRDGRRKLAELLNGDD